MSRPKIPSGRTGTRSREGPGEPVQIPVLSLTCHQKLDSTSLHIEGSNYLYQHNTRKYIYIYIILGRRGHHIYKYNVTI